VSHKFNVEIELEDARYCDGCPCMKWSRLAIGAPECQRFAVYLNKDGDPQSKWYKVERPAVCIEAEKAIAEAVAEKDAEIMRLREALRGLLNTFVSYCGTLYESQISVADMCEMRKALEEKKGGEA